MLPNANRLFPNLRHLETDDSIRHAERAMRRFETVVTRMDTPK